MGFTFNPEQAKKAGAGQYVSVGGVYTGKITTAEYKRTNDGAVFVDFSFENDDGQKCNFVSVFVKNKDGSESLQVASMYALMGLLKLKDLKEVKKVVDGKDVYHYPAIEGQKITYAVYRDEYYKKDNTIGYSFKLINFFDSVSKQSYKELAENSPAIAHTRPIVDKTITKSGQPNNKQTEEDDLPF